MKIYFLSSSPCELTLNGVFFGITDRFERFAEVNLADNVFAKFTPQGALPLGVFLCEELLTSPPTGFEVYLLKDGVALFAKEFPPSDFTLTPIAQERFGENLITVFRQGVLQLSIQTSKSFFISTLPPSFASCKLSFHADLFFIEGQNQLAVYTKGGKCVFLEQILTFEVSENTLNATLPLSDTLGRVAECSYVLSENGCERTKFTLQQRRTTDGATEPQKIKNELLPYAFFESVLLGADYAELLSDELKPSAKQIKSFLGDFEGVVPTNDPKTCGLVRRKAPRLFELAYFTAQIENDKIIDVQG